MQDMWIHDMEAVELTKICWFPVLTRSDHPEMFTQRPKIVLSTFFSQGASKISFLLEKFFQVEDNVPSNLETGNFFQWGDHNAIFQIFFDKEIDFATFMKVSTFLTN